MRQAALRRDPRANPGFGSGTLTAETAHVLLVGSPTRALQKSLDRLGVRCVRSPNARFLTSKVTNETRAIVILAPLEKPVVDVAEQLNEFDRELPVFVVVRALLKRADVRRLYERGVHGVFSWPAEREPFMRTVFRIAGDARKLARAVALEELVRERLATAPIDAPRIRAKVYRRFVLFEGVVDSLWKLHALAAIAKRVPGVDEVVLSSARVSEQLDDTAIHSAVDAVLDHAGVDRAGLATSVQDGRVVLAGTVVSRHQLSRAIGLIEHIRGVTGIDCFAAVSPKRNVRASRLASKIDTSIRAHHPKSRVEVSVFGTVVVLNGKVRLANDRSDIVELALSHPGVDRVVDKLVVRRR